MNMLRRYFLFAFLLFPFATSEALELADLKSENLRSAEMSFPLPEKSPAYGELAPLNPKNTLPPSLENDPLIVVHATAFFDEAGTAKAGIDKIVSAFTRKGKTVIYLVSDQSGQGYSDWYTGDRRPDYELFSAGGEHNLPLAGREVTIAGGFFGSYDGARGCHALAARDAIRMHFELSDSPFTVNMPLEAIYFYGEDLPTKKELLALDPLEASEEKISKAFERFAELFFLVDNFETSEEDALGFAHPFNSPEQNPSYREGEPVDTARYSFEIIFKGLRVSRFGKGPRKVVLNLLNEVKPR